MASNSQLSRYGAISKAIPDLAPGAKVFFVSDSDDTTVGPLNLQDEFPTDEDGTPRVYTTIQAAVNAASANRGDVVLVLPGYDHTLGRADSWATAGVHVIGLGTGNARPIVRYTATTDEVGIAANNVHVKNIRFLSAVDSCARAVDLDTGFSGAHIEECAFDFNANTNDFRTMLRVGQARSLIENNEFRAEDTAGAGRAIEFNGGYADFTKVRGNFFYGQFDTVGDTTNVAGIIALPATHDSGDTVLSGLLLADNYICSTDTAAPNLLNMGSGACTVRGLCANNTIGTYDSSTADTTGFAGGGLKMVNNLIGTADSSTEKRIGDTIVVLS